VTDIVDKLRESYSHLNRDDALTSNSVDTIRKAVSEIERLRAERERLVDALKDIESPSIDIVCHGSWEAFEWAMERAAEALKENDQ
jgi:hypothetical protein